MHSKIICSNGQEIIDDDGVLFCSADCKSSQ